MESARDVTNGYHQDLHEYFLYRLIVNLEYQLVAFQ